MTFATTPALINAREWLFFTIACIGLSMSLLVPNVTAQTFFTECPDDPNIDNTTVIVDENVLIEFPNGDDLTTGDEIAFFTVDDVCAGVGVWDEADGEDLVITVSGPAGVVQDEIEGYEDGEPLKLQVWQQTTDRLFDVGDELSFETCEATDPLCRDDGVYETDAVSTIIEIGSGVLPVELASFSLRLQNDYVEAIWHTLSETNNSGFTLQHRLNLTDSWESLGFISGAGTTDTPQNYSFTTSPLSFGTHHFQLLQHDHDGTTALIAEQQVEHRLTDTPIVAILAPQPVRDHATLTITTMEQQTTRVELFDVLGRRLRLLHHGTLASSEPHPIAITTEGLSPGQYIIRIQSGPTLMTRRMIVVR